MIRKIFSFLFVMLLGVATLQSVSAQQRRPIDSHAERFCPAASPY